MFTFKYLIDLNKIKGKYKVSKIIFQNQTKYGIENFLMSNNQVVRLIESIDRNDYNILESSN